MNAYSFLMLLFVIATVSAAGIDSKLSAQGSGSVSRTQTLDWQSTSGDDYVMGGVAHKIMTSPGDFQYQTKDTLDATKNNRYNQTGYYRFDDGGFVYDMASSETSDPYQSVFAGYGGYVGSAEVSSAKFVNDADMLIGQQAQWDGAGIYVGDAEHTVSSEVTENTVKKTYRTTGRDHFVIDTNASGGAIVRPEFSFMDFGDAFIFTNSSSNLSANNTSVNQT